LLTLTRGDMRPRQLVAKVGRGGKVKIRFEDGPHPGLGEYIRWRALDTLASGC
jgi:hypothetical protein